MGWAPVQPSGRTAGLAMLVTAMVLVGSTVVASKLISEGMPPFAATALRFAVATPIFLVLCRGFGQRWPRLGRRDWVLLAVQAAAGSVGYTVFLLSGVALTAAANASVAVGTLPVVVALLGQLVLGERIGRGTGLAVLAAAAGALVVAAGNADVGLGVAGAGDAAALAGLALVFCAVGCEGVFLLLNKRLARPLPALLLSTVMSGLGFGFALPFAAVELTLQPDPVPSGAAVLATLYYALVPTVGGYVLWYAGTARTDAGDAGLATAVMPVSALLLSALVLGEAISVAQALGGALVTAAILIQARLGRASG